MPSQQLELKSDITNLFKDLESIAKETKVHAPHVPKIEKSDKTKTVAEIDRDKLEKIINIPLWSNKIKDDGYNVKEYQPGDYYNWHVDAFTHADGWTRTIACIWYLNQVEEGGETEFALGHKVIPSKGKLILFPSTWNFPHRGLSPIKGNKYIITSFLMTNDSLEDHYYES